VTFELSELDQMMVWPVSGAPLASRTVAASCADPPGMRSDESGATMTDATAGGVTPVGCSFPPPQAAENAARIKTAESFEFKNLRMY